MVIAVLGCEGCGICVEACKYNAIAIKNKRVVIDYTQCTECYECVKVCQYNALVVID